MLSIALLTACAPVPEPILWLDTEGALFVKGSLKPTRIRQGTKVVRSGPGRAFEFEGGSSGIMIEDSASFHLGQSVTVAAWINPRAYVEYGVGAQILFRGDDRSGLDPYSLVIHADGTVNFGIQSAANEAVHVSSPLPLSRWTHVLGSLNGRTGEISLWIDGKLRNRAVTTLRPLIQLDSASSPGIGIGNVQNDRGPHNQPFIGQLADLRLYADCLTPAQIGFEPQGWNSPYRDRASR